MRRQDANGFACDGHLAGVSPSPARPWPLAVLATLLLAGCTGGDGGGAPAAGDDASARPVPGAGETVLRFAGLQDDVDATVWANGTVAVQDTCNTGACILDTSRAYHVTDITGDVPAGVPVELTVDLSYEPSAVFGGPEVLLNAPESVVYYARTTIDFATGRGSILAMLRPAGDVEVVVAANAPGGDLPETAYTLSIGIVAGPERVSPGAPIAVTLGPGSNLTYRAPGQAAPPFLLYGPDDALLGLMEGHVALPADAARGDYVVLLPNGSPSGNLSSDTASSMRALGLRTELGPEGQLPEAGAYDASWDVTGVPFAVGVAAYAPPDATPVGGPLLSTGFQASLTGANGVKVESGPVCGFCLTFGFGAFFGSGTGDPAVVAQRYDVHAQTSGATYGLRIAPYARYLDRA